MNVLPHIVNALAGGALFFGFSWSLKYVILPLFAPQPEYKPARGAHMTRF